MTAKVRQPTPAQYHRIIFAWREMRRGVAMAAYRDLLFEGLDLGALDALDLLIARDRIRMIDFASALRIEKSTATRALDRLESAGLAERESVAAKNARRSVIVHITGRGRALHAKLLRRRVQLLKQMTRAFSPDEILVLGELLERLVGGIDYAVAQARAATPAVPLRTRKATPRQRRGAAARSS
jgi:DNA-binding MarR family transcriptional regulator